MKHTFTSPLVRSIVAASILFSAGPAFADSTGVPVTMSVQPGLLTLYASDYASLGAVSTSHMSNSISTGTLGTVAVDDSRNTNVGWNVSATFSNLASYSTFTTDQGQPGPFVVSGAYTGRRDLDFTLTTGSSFSGNGLGNMYYSLIDQYGTRYTEGSVQVMQSTQAIGATGLTFSAPNIDFLPNTAYHLHVHVLSAANYEVTPGTVDAGGQTNDTAPSASCRPVDENAPCTLMQALPGNGNGLYRVMSDLTFNVAAGTPSGDYHGQIVETIL